MWIIAQNGMGYDLMQLRDLGVRNTLSGYYLLEARMKCDRSRVRLGAFEEKADAKRALHGVRHGGAAGKSIVRIGGGKEPYRYI